MRISDWSSDVCSSDLCCSRSSSGGSSRTSSFASDGNSRRCALILAEYIQREWMDTFNKGNFSAWTIRLFAPATSPGLDRPHGRPQTIAPMAERSEEHTSELQSLMRTSYAVFCLNKKKNNNNK